MKRDPERPELAAEPGWVALNMPAVMQTAPTYVSGHSSEDGLCVRYYQRPEDGALVGKAWFGPGTQGPPGHAHGGSLAALLDEAMGFSAWTSGHAVVAAQLTVNFREMLPLGNEVLFEAWVDVVNGRKVHTRGRVFSRAGTTYGDAQALFLKLDPERFGKMADAVTDQASATEDPRA